MAAKQNPEKELHDFALGYWTKVEKSLISRFKFTAQRAHRAVTAYQREIKRQGIGDIVYHQDVAEAAEGAKALDSRKTTRHAAKEQPITRSRKLA
jgi:hypothetical protein